MTTMSAGATGPKPRVFVFLRHGLSLESWGTDSPEQPLNTSSPYGYAAARGVTILTWSTDAREGRLSGLLRRATRRALGFDLIHAWRNREGLASADVVWTHTERESLAALAVLRLLRRRHTLVIAQTVWLWDEWPHLPALKRRLYLSLLGDAAVEVTLSELNKAAARRVRATDDVYCLPFGAGLNEEVVTRALREVHPGSGGYVLAVGSDRHRDWAALHEAARALPQVSFRVATLSDSYPALSAPSNVTVTPAHSLDELYKMYVGAAVVVLPLTENLHASGCTVALEAQRLGRPLVTADVGGLGMYLGTRGVHLYRPEEPGSLASTLRAALENQETDDAETSDQRFLLRQGLTVEDYAARFVLLTRWLLSGEPAPAAAEIVAPVRGLLTPDPGGSVIPERGRPN